MSNSHGNPTDTRNSTSYITRLDQTLKVIQDRVMEQEATLEQLRAASSSLDIQPVANDIFHLRQVRSLNSTYESLIVQDPYLPSPDSPLPALLALRITQDCIDEIEDSITNAELILKKTQSRLQEERSDLEDAKIISSGLKSRILSLQGEKEQRSQKTPGQIAKEMIRDMRKKRSQYDIETGKLVKAFNGFIDEHLAPMLAAEELGGPVVGEALDIDEVMLQGGFNSQGRPTRSKNSGDRDKRQRRIDEIWGPRPLEDEKTKKPWNEKQAAAAEIRELTEQLLNSLVEVNESGPGAYIDLDRESAAARFLVRSKVAQFHPRDARRLRLIDFGGEIED